MPIRCTCSILCLSVPGDVESPANTAASSQGLLESDDDQADFEDIDDTVLFVIRSLQAMHYKQMHVAADLQKHKYFCKTYCEVQSMATILSDETRRDKKSQYGDIGTLLTVHNGHNGWLGKTALQQFLTHVADKILKVSREEQGGLGGATSRSSEAVAY